MPTSGVPGQQATFSAMQAMSVTRTYVMAMPGKQKVGESSRNGDRRRCGFSIRQACLHLRYQQQPMLTMPNSNQTAKEEDSGMGSGLNQIRRSSVAPDV
jgi:hypothetical protein